MSQSLRLPIYFISFACDSSRLIEIIPDWNPPYNSIVFPATKFACGDSVIVNVSTGTYKVQTKNNFPDRYLLENVKNPIGIIYLISIYCSYGAYHL